MNDPKEPQFTCASCEKDVFNVFPNHDDVIQPETGLHVGVYMGYGMFNDTLDDPEVNKMFATLVFCHHCSIKFVDMLNPTLRKYFTKSHPDFMCTYEIDEQPCKYSSVTQGWIKSEDQNT